MSEACKEEDIMVKAEYTAAKGLVQKAGDGLLWIFSETFDLLVPSHPVHGQGNLLTKHRN